MEHYILVGGDNSINVIDLFLPVGIIISLNSNINPNDLYSGTTWEQVEGKMLIGSDPNDEELTAGNTGGSKTHRHDFKIGLLEFYNALVGSGSLANQGAYKYSTKKYAGGVVDGTVTQNVNAGFTTSWSSSTYGPNRLASTGDTDLGSNMPPYKVVYMWERIS